MFESIVTCKLFTNDEGVYSALSERYMNSSVIVENVEFIVDCNVPTKIIGWSTVHSLFPLQKISESIITDNLSWGLSHSDGNKDMIKDIEKFVNESLDLFLGVPSVSYDFVMDGDLKTFLSSTISKEKKYHIYFYNNACYFFDGEKNIIIGLDSIDAHSKDSRDIITRLINKLNCRLFGYENSREYVDLGLIENKVTLENFFWMKFGISIELDDIRSLLGRNDIGRSMSFITSLLFSSELSAEEIVSCNRQAVRDIITCWLSSRAVFFDEKFTPEQGVKIRWHNYMKYTKPVYSDKRARTGRIYCVSQFNPQILPKDSPVRKNIISRFKNGGKLVVFDYVSFETKLSMYYSKDEEFVNKYVDTDIHAELAKVIYQRESITEKERGVGKLINHAIIYGGGDKLLMSKLSDVDDKHRALADIKNMLKPILDTSEFVNNICDEYGFVVNDFGTIIRPKKIYAAYQNFIGSTAAEVVADKLYEIKNYISGKNIHFLFQIHDSFIFDVAPEELHRVDELSDLLSTYKGFSFPVGVRMGSNYQQCG